MKFRFQAAFLAASIAIPGAAVAQTNMMTMTMPASQPDIADKVEKLSYAFGMYFANQLKGANVTTNEVNPDILGAAMRDVLSSNTTRLSEGQVRETIMAFSQQKRAEAMAKRKEQGEKNLKAGEEFLAANKSKDGVQTKTVELPGGKTAEFQYKIIKQGSGDPPQATDQVMVKYVGKYIDGREFDDSAKHDPTHADSPSKLSVSGVIKGWSEALKMMPPGSKWEIFLPPDLAYGENGPLEPNSTLDFEVELVSIVPPAPPQAAMTPGQPLTSDIIKVPSKEGLAKGEKIEVIKPEDVAKMTNSPAGKN